MTALRHPTSIALPTELDKAILQRKREFVWEEVLERPRLILCDDCLCRRSGSWAIPSRRQEQCLDASCRCHEGAA